MGILLELVKVNPKMRTAVEVSGGGNLLQVVVDTDTTAGKVMKIVKDFNLGRMSCMPLSVIQTPRFN